MRAWLPPPPRNLVRCMGVCQLPPRFPGVNNPDMMWCMVLELAEVRAWQERRLTNRSHTHAVTHCLVHMCMLTMRSSRQAS